MFGNAIIDGLKIFFSNWEIWLVVLLYLAFSVSFMFFMGISFTSIENNNKVGIASFWILFLSGPVVQGILATIIVITLFPLFCGGSGIVSFNFFIENWEFVLKYGFLAMMFVFLLSFIPILGRLIEVPGISFAIQSIVVFNGIFFPVFNKRHPGLEIHTKTIELFLSLAISVLIVYLIEFIIIYLTPKREKLSLFSIILANSINVIPGILCLCIYSSYLVSHILNTVLKTY